MQEPSHFFETSAMLISFVLLGRVLEAVAKGSIFFSFFLVLLFVLVRSLSIYLFPV